jgi:MFS family permease
VRGIGGITGAIISSYMTEHYHPKWCILIYSILGFFIAYSGIKLNPEIDREGLESMNGFVIDLKRSGKEIYEIRRIPEIYLVLLYIILRGMLVPSFGDFWYYYVINVKEFTQFQYGMMSVVGNIALMIGAFLYSKYFFKWEFRYILTVSNLIAFVGGVLGAAFVLDIHKMVGLSDYFFYGV